MSVQPGFAWPEPRVYLDGSVLHVHQARWRQTTSFLKLPAGSKWLVNVYVDGTLVHGDADMTSPPGSIFDTTTYTGEMPLEQKAMSVDLASYGVHESHPLDPVVRVDQFAGSPNTTGYWWSGDDWERNVVPSRIYIDGRAGVPARLTLPSEPELDAWCPLSRCFYDEAAEEGVHWTGYSHHSVEPFGAAEGSYGIQFFLALPEVTIDGIQVWLPPSLWSPGPGPESITVRLWRGPAVSAGTDVVAIKTETPLPGWTNVLFDEPYPAETSNILNPSPPAGDPYDLIDNPDHDGWYTAGVQQVNERYYDTGENPSYAPYYPEHQKVYGADNYPAASWAVNRYGPDDEKGPEWSPSFNNVYATLVGPILTYRPPYPVPIDFVPQIYRRVVEVG